MKRAGWFFQVLSAALLSMGAFLVAFTVFGLAVGIVLTIFWSHDRGASLRFDGDGNPFLVREASGSAMWFSQGLGEEIATDLDGNPIKTPKRETEDTDFTADGAQWGSQVRHLDTVDNGGPADDWYVMHQPGEPGDYLVGYASKTRRRIGYFGTAGFSAEMPPKDERFAQRPYSPVWDKTPGRPKGETSDPDAVAAEAVPEAAHSEPAPAEAAPDAAAADDGPRVIAVPLRRAGDAAAADASDGDTEDSYDLGYARPYEPRDDSRIFVARSEGVQRRPPDAPGAACFRKPAGRGSQHQFRSRQFAADRSHGRRHLSDRPRRPAAKVSASRRHCPPSAEVGHTNRRWADGRRRAAGAKLQRLYVCLRAFRQPGLGLCAARRRQRDRPA